MEIQFPYEKKRYEFGRQCMFSDKGPDLIDNFLPKPKHLKQYLLRYIFRLSLFCHKYYKLFRDPVHQGTQCGPIQAEHNVNTMRAEYYNTAMNHVEGGWPKEVNINDEEQTKRYRRKVERDESFNHTILHLAKVFFLGCLKPLY